MTTAKIDNDNSIERNKWTYVNLSPTLVLGQALDDEGNKINVSFDDERCKPLMSGAGQEYYRVRMLPGSRFERDGQIYDLSHLSTTIKASCVHMSEHSQYPSVGLCYHEDYKPCFKQSIRQGSEYIETARINVSVKEMSAAVRAGKEHYRAVLANKAQARDAPAKTTPAKEKKTVASVGAKAQAKAKALNAERTKKTPTKKQGASKAQAK